ncbi:peroxiredoxin 2 family [Fusarium longipes]|uniref:Peroxiredoxin 2 family n=1 Tax=Fusarium longipes TaxID=694270 RepID=A0A395SMR7_9HYPO|nr:peroxiredoxin 2 family [Fusarium longipes]
MADNHTEDQTSKPVKSPIERKPVGGIPPKDPAVERTPTLPTRPTKDIDKKGPEAPSCDTCSVPQKKSASTRSKSPPSPIKVDKSQPEDFEGELATNNEIPSLETLKKIENYIVLDRHGKSHPFKTLYTGSNVARRVLIIFVRHFFCGNCQEFLRSLSEAVTPEALLRLPVSTFIAVIGCGDPALIDMYVNETGCRFPVYTDPTRSIFDGLGMSKTLQMGAKPAYMRRSMAHSIVGSIIQGVKQIPTGNVLKMGDQRQVGGEFLFEPRDILTPVTTPRNEKAQPISAFEEAEEPAPGVDGHVNEEKRVTWCHRMKTTRDHAEIPELIEVLGLDQSATAGREVNRGSVTSARKGKGQSMAQEIRKLSAERSRTSNET